MDMKGKLSSNATEKYCYFYLQKVILSEKGDMPC